MESIGSSHHHHTFLRALPCDLRLGNYFISIDKIDEFEPVNGHSCPALVVHFNSGTPRTILCPRAYGFATRHEYTCHLTNTLTDWFTRLGFQPAIVARLALEVGSFVLDHAWSHCCPSRRHGRVVKSVPHIVVTRASLVMQRLSEGAAPRVKRATDESIEALEEIRRIDLGQEDQRSGSCMVCLENFDVEVQQGMVRMGCNHVFHKDCIVEWLKNSHICPLCRFEMPAIED